MKINNFKTSKYNDINYILLYNIYARNFIIFPEK